MYDEPVGMIIAATLAGPEAGEPPGDPAAWPDPFEATLNPIVATNATIRRTRGKLTSPLLNTAACLRD